MTEEITPLDLNNPKVLASALHQEEIDLSGVTDEALAAALNIAYADGVGDGVVAQLKHEQRRRDVRDGRTAARATTAAARTSNPSVADTPPGLVVYQDTIMLPDEISLADAVSITDFMSERGKATLDAAAQQITFEIECADLWEACMMAHEVAAELAGRHVYIEIDRGALTEADES